MVGNEDQHPRTTAMGLSVEFAKTTWKTPVLGSEKELANVAIFSVNGKYFPCCFSLDLTFFFLLFSPVEVTLLHLSDLSFPPETSSSLRPPLLIVLKGQYLIDNLFWERLNQVTKT